MPTPPHYPELRWRQQGPAWPHRRGGLAHLDLPFKISIQGSKLLLPLLSMDEGLTRGRKGPLNIRAGALMLHASMIDRDLQLTPPVRKTEVFHLKAGVDIGKLRSKLAKRASYLEKVVADGSLPTCKLHRLAGPLFCAMECRDGVRHYPW